MKILVRLILLAGFLTCVAFACGGLTAAGERTDQTDTPSVVAPQDGGDDTGQAGGEEGGQPGDGSAEKPGGEDPGTVGEDPVVPPVPVTARDTMVLRILDYNVGRLHKELDPTECAPMIGSMIDEMKVDAVTLQELDSVRSGGRFQLRFLVNNTPGNWNYFFGSNFTYGEGGTYGLGVMLDKKYPVVRSYHYRMPKFDGAEVRGFTVMESEHFVVISTHLDHKSIDARQQQMLVLNEQVKAAYQNSGKLVFLAGDFNGNQTGGVVINAKKAWTRVSSDDYTSTAKNPKNTIDHMFILNNGAQYKIREARALTKFQNGGDVKKASDHLPIFIEFEFYYDR